MVTHQPLKLRVGGSSPPGGTMRYTVESAIACIERNGGAVARGTKVVTAKSPGIRVWGAIDYLVNQHNYAYVQSA